MKKISSLAGGGGAGLKMGEKMGEKTECTPSGAGRGIKLAKTLRRIVKIMFSSKFTIFQYHIFLPYSTDKQKEKETIQDISDWYLLALQWIFRNNQAL